MRNKRPIYGLVVRPAFALTMTLLTSAAARADYLSTVLSDGPLAYYRLNDPTQRTNINRNSGSLGTAGNTTNINVHPLPGAIAGSGNRSQFFDSRPWTLTPWNAALNPTNTLPFTVEAWFYPASDQIN